MLWHSPFTPPPQRLSWKEKQYPFGSDFSQMDNSFAASHMHADNKKQPVKETLRAELLLQGRQATQAIP